MKKIIFLTTIFFFGFFKIHGQNLNLEWAKHFNGPTGSNCGFSLDFQDNLYTCGSFGGTVDFDPGIGENFINSTNLDFYVSKLDEFGNLVWVKTFPNTSTSTENHLTSIDTDTLGNIYITGTYNGTIDFDPNIGQHIEDHNPNEFFVLKLDYNGNFLWVKTFNFNAYYSPKIKLDFNGNCYITGSYNNAADFDPSSNIYQLYTGFLDENAFILKLDSDGNFVWAKNIGSSGTDYGATIYVDEFKNIYLTGIFEGTVDFDFGTGVFNLTSNASSDIFILKLDSLGNFNWVKGISGGEPNEPSDIGITTDRNGNVFTFGTFGGTIDADPGVGVFNLGSGVYGGGFVLKLNSLGDFVWAKSYNNLPGVYSGSIYPFSIITGKNGEIYTSGSFRMAVDFDPGIGNFAMYGGTGQHVFISKLDTNGNLMWAKDIPAASTYTTKLKFDSNSKLIICGNFGFQVDFDLGNDVYNLSPNNNSTFFAKYNEKGVYGFIYNDLNSNCIRTWNELGLENHFAIINPGNIIVQTDRVGKWVIDSLPAGNYTISIDTLNDWITNCPSLLEFSVFDSIDVNFAGALGLTNINPCSAPVSSITMPFLRPCFSEQKIYVNSCNDFNGTSVLSNAYTIVELDSSLMVETVSMPYTSISANEIRVNLGSLSPGECVNFTLDVTLSCDVLLGQTLCMESKLFPLNTCVYDTIPNTVSNDFNPCNLPWDNSNLSIEAHCRNDSIHFLITNIGLGNMNCYSPVRLFIDGDYMWLDSINLIAGQSKTYGFSADGRTWRMEVDQHPLYPGNSHPNVSIEACGNIDNWTQNLINILAHDDLDPFLDIYCGVTTSSFDPNDKTGYPLGIDSSHLILPNGQIDYVIRFQNTGTDTAFTVVVRDTLDYDLDIFSVQSGASSHPYIFRVYDSRILEWRFYDILLPDSTSNELESHGFVSFNISQNNDLIDGTEITNKVGIYFDYNEPIITNTTLHTIDRGIQNNQVRIQKSINLEDCNEVIYNTLKYTKTGAYYQLVSGGVNADTLFLINVFIKNSFSNISVNACDTFISPNGQICTQSGIYSAVVTNYLGCDSTITINLTINNNFSTLNPISCDSYTAPDNQIYTQSGTYTSIIPNSMGCDSTITINLTINNSTTSSISQSVCDTYTAPDNQVYTQSGTYTSIISNSKGCDSTITINLTVNNSTSSTISESVCDTYTAPDNQVYTQSGTYIARISNDIGCDSIITINLVVNNSSSIINESVCNSYTAPDNQVYTQSGTYTAIIPNFLGCDSTITINLSVNASSSTINELACQGTYTAPDGQVYTQSGTYTAIIPNTSLCDSTITINLTMANPSSSIINESVCNSYTAPDNQVYIQSGTYLAIIPNSSGCDSTITINLDIKSNSSSTISESVCNSYTSPDNQVYTQSGTYTAIIPNTSGCDSMITINLSVNATSSTLTESVCNSYIAPDNQVFTQSGTYTSIIPNSQACDSIITINLTIYNVNTALTNLSPTLVAIANSVSYQWLDCLNGNQTIVGETNQSFTATQNGEYAVIISQNTCSDTSTCMVISNVGFNELNTTNFSLSPNPTVDFLNIIFENSKENISIKLLTLSGQIVLQESNLFGKEIKIDLSSQAKGMYLLEVELDSKKEVLKVIKE